MSTKIPLDQLVKVRGHSHEDIVKIIKDANLGVFVHPYDVPSILVSVDGTLAIRYQSRRSEIANKENHNYFRFSEIDVLDTEENIKRAKKIPILRDTYSEDSHEGLIYCHSIVKAFYSIPPDFPIRREDLKYGDLLVEETRVAYEVDRGGSGRVPWDSPDWTPPHTPGTDW